MGRSHLAILLSAGLLAVASSVARGESFTDFEAGGFAAGESVNQHEQDGTKPPQSPVADPPLGPWRVWSVQLAGTDESIVDLTELDPQPGLEQLEHGKVWRLSSAASAGRVQSPPDHRSAGENAPAQAAFGKPGSTRYRAQLAFRSATGSAQPGLHLVFAAASRDRRQAELHVASR
jgi:hypothetical protein